MMIDLVKYEMLKLWKKMKSTYLAISLIQVAILVIIIIFMPDTLEVQIAGDNISSISDVLLGFLLMIYFLSSLVIIFVPIAESCSILSSDLSGKQSTLELLLPPLTWKKIISKLIVVLLHTILCSLLALLFIVLFLIANVDHSFKFLLDSFGAIFQSPIEYFLVLLGFVNGILSICIVIYFCIVFSKSLTHKKKIAIPIGICTFVGIITSITFIVLQLQKYPLYKYMLLGVENSISIDLLDIIVFVLAFLGTTWLIDNKIEN